MTLDGGSKLKVIIKNLSATGARVEYSVRTVLPDDVLLTEPTLQIKRRARVVWRGEGVAGLRFI